MRDILIHYHLFKNAGSSVDAVLAQHFGKAWAKLDGIRPWERVGDATLLDFILARPALRALSSHQARPPGPATSELRIHPVIFLRHPIDRAGSVYAFERTLPRDTSPGATMAHDLAFPEYVDWRLDEGDGGTLCNFQTLFIGWREGDDGSEPAAQRARDLMGSLPCVGLVERFAESMAKISARLEPVFGALPAPSVALNRNANRESDLGARLEAIRQALGPQRYQRLCRQNGLDLELHALVSERFAED